MTGPNRHMANGTVIDNGDDPLASLYWKTGIDAEAPLDQFVTEKVTKEFQWLILRIRLIPEKN